MPDREPTFISASGTAIATAEIALHCVGWVILVFWDHAHTIRPFFRFKQYHYQTKNQ